MKRRDFLKGALAGAGLAATGMLPGKSKAAPSNTSGNTFENRKQGVDFYKIDSFCHFVPISYLDYLQNTLGGPFNSLRLIAAGTDANHKNAILEHSDVEGLGPRLKMMDDEGIDVSIIFPQPDIEGGLGPKFTLTDPNSSSIPKMSYALKRPSSSITTCRNCVQITPLNSNSPHYSR